MSHFQVCNHPELFERRDTQSPFVMKALPYTIPKLIYRNYFTRNQDSLKIRLSFHHPSQIHYQYSKVCQNLKHSRQEKSPDREILEVPEDPYAFLKIAEISPAEFDSAFNDFQFRIAHWAESRIKIAAQNFRHEWHPEEKVSLILPEKPVPIQIITKSEPVFGFNDIKIKCMKETLRHRVIRSKKNQSGLATAFPHTKRPDIVRKCQLINAPNLLLNATCPTVVSTTRVSYSYDSEWPWRNQQHLTWLPKASKVCDPLPFHTKIIMPDKESLVSDAGKLAVLDDLLAKLKTEGHRVLIYSQMTKMIDLLEEFMNHRKHTYMRLDGSSKIHERRDMVNDFQQRSDIFIFLLSTRAGGLGINLTAADTVIFYDSDWNPTVDQQAMDRAHR